MHFSCRGVFMTQAAPDFREAAATQRLGVARAIPLPVKGRVEKHGADSFTEMSSQLADSFHMLEHRVAELNEELTQLGDRRLAELAEKERSEEHTSELQSRENI